MPNHDMPSVMPGHGGRWRGVLSIALLVGSAAATLFAVTVVISLFWWISTISPGNSEPVAAPKPRAVAAPAAKPAVAAAPRPMRPRAPVPTPADDANRSGAAPAPAPAAQAAAPQIPEPPGHQREGDAERNRKLAAGLSRLGNDPEALRRLGLPQQSPSQ